MYKTVIVGPQLLHSEENITSLSSTSDNLHPPHPSVFDNIFTKKKQGVAFPRAGQPGLPPSPTAACRPFRHPGWWPHAGQVWTVAALLPVQKHLEMVFLFMISPAKICTRWNLHDHYQPRLPLSKTGVTQCARNNDVTKRSCSPFKKVKCRKI